MKKISLLFIALFIAITGIMAQVPYKFNYQCVIRDANEQVIANTGITVGVAILEGSSTGTQVFTELHNTTTNSQGLVYLEIGSLANLDIIEWGADIYYIELSVNGVTMGATQLLSVPYTLYAAVAETADYNKLTNLPILFDGDYNSLTNRPILFDGIFSSLSNTPTTLAGYGITDAFGGSYDDLTNQPNLDIYITNETDPVFNANFNFTNVITGDLVKYDGVQFVNFTPNYLSLGVDGYNSGNNQIKDVSPATDPNDAITLGQVDTKITEIILRLTDSIEKVNEETTIRYLDSLTAIQERFNDSLFTIQNRFEDSLFVVKNNFADNLSILTSEVYDSLVVVQNEIYDSLVVVQNEIYDSLVVVQNEIYDSLVVVQNEIYDSLVVVHTELIDSLHNHKNLLDILTNQNHLQQLEIDILKNISVTDLLQNYSIEELIAAGISVNQLLTAGVTLQQLLNAGFTTDEFIGINYLGGLIAELNNDGSGFIVKKTDCSYKYIVRHCRSRHARACTPSHHTWGTKTVFSYSEALDKESGDWIIPNYEQLNKIYSNKSVLQINNSTYWYKTNRTYNFVNGTTNYCSSCTVKLRLIKYF